MKQIPILVFLFILTSASFSQAQIVNVESQRIQTDTTGWSGSLGGNFSLTKSTSHIFSANGYATVQFKTGKNIYLFLGNYGFLKGNKNKFIDNAFLHLRFDRKITNFFRWEIFTQYQYNWSPNDILKLVSTTFYQPRLNHISDFRILNQETATLSITKKLSATINWNYLYDALPVEGIPKSNFTLSTGLKYIFNP